MNDLFDKQLSSQTRTADAVHRFATLWPIFQVSKLRERGIDYWTGAYTSREAMVRAYVDAGAREFAPACYLEHEEVPLDWATRSRRSTVSGAISFTARRRGVRRMTSRLSAQRSRPCSRSWTKRDCSTDSPNSASTAASCRQDLPVQQTQMIVFGDYRSQSGGLSKADCSTTCSTPTARSIRSKSS